MIMSLLYASLSFLIGAAAGFQGIYERYRKSSGRAVSTFWGILYLLSRGILPTLVFIVVTAHYSISNFLWLYALGCGAGAEIILRSQLYIRSVKTEVGAFQEISKGLFDVLRWWQGFFLESISGRLAELRKDAVQRILGDGSGFKNLVLMYWNNKGAWPDANA